MSDAPYEIDYDSEAVFFENAWHSRADLAQQIRAMIDRGDYRVARPSAALEALEAGLSGARVLAVRVSPELADSVEEKAGREGRSVAAVIRDALQAALRQPEKAPSSPPPSRQGPSVTEVSAGPANTVATGIDRGSTGASGASARAFKAPVQATAAPSRISGASAAPGALAQTSGISGGTSGFSPGPSGSSLGASGFSPGSPGASGFSPGPSGSSPGASGFSAGPYGFTPGPGDISAGPGGVSARLAAYSAGPSGVSAMADSISAGIASISAGPLGASAGPANAARPRSERAGGAPPLAQVAERLAEAVLAETDGAPQGDPRADETWFGR